MARCLLYWIIKLEARFMSGDYAAAIGRRGKQRRCSGPSDAHIQLLDYHFYSALASRRPARPSRSSSNASGFAS